MIMKEIKVNDGKGLYDNIGLIDSLIVDCNDLPKSLINGQFVQFCSRIVQMVQKLSNLRDGVKNDIESKDGQITALLQEKENLINQLSIKEKGEL